MALPPFNELTRPTLEVVVNSDDAMHVSGIRAHLIDLFGVTETDKEEALLSGEEKFYNRVRWVVWYLKDAGLLHSPSRATFGSTPEGKEYLDNHPGPIEQKTLKGISKQKQQSQGANAEEDRSLSPAIVPTDTETADIEDVAPDELMDQAFAQIEQKLASDFQEAISRVSPKRFEELAIELLEAMGYGIGEHTGGPHDQGIDGIIRADPLGLKSVYYLQAKHTGNNVGRDVIDQLAGTVQRFGATGGVVATSARFTDDGMAAASGSSIQLIDGSRLIQLMIKHGVGVVTERTYEIKKLDENYFAEDV